MSDGIVHVYSIDVGFWWVTLKVLLKPSCFLSFLCFILCLCVCVCVKGCWANHSYAMVYMIHNRKVSGSAG
jgi:hypothetical protein